jgi:iron-sulfur cluster repair protein YtfE (RIC family)
MRNAPRGANLEATAPSGRFVMTTEEIETVREGHFELRQDLDHIRLAAQELPRVSPEERRVMIDRILEYLRDTVLPHAADEEQSLYPLVGKILGNPEATHTMIHDHLAIRARVVELAATAEHDVDRLQELLYGLYALITVHFWKEDQLYLPLLERPAWPVFDG